MAALRCKNQRPYVFHRNVKTLCLSNGPTFAVLVVQNPFASAFSSTEEQLPDDQGMQNEAKHGPAITPGSIQSIKGNVA